MSQGAREEGQSYLGKLTAEGAFVPSRALLCPAGVVHGREGPRSYKPF